MQTYKVEQNPKSFRSPSQASARSGAKAGLSNRQTRRARFLNQARDIKLTTRTAELMAILFDMRS